MKVGGLQGYRVARLWLNSGKLWGKFVFIWLTCASTLFKKNIICLIYKTLIFMQKPHNLETL